VGTHGGLNWYWPLPFATKARVVVANEGAQDCNALYFQVDYRKLEQPLPDALHFFAAYRQAFPLAKGQPYEILQTGGGQGYFAGCNLSVEQQDEGWWGEGDVAMFVDGESKPSIVGTGSEDDLGGPGVTAMSLGMRSLARHCVRGLTREGFWSTALRI
jgi:hypothetical protein